MITWGARDMANRTNGLDIYARTFSSTGIGGTTKLINSHLSGDQYPRAFSVIGAD